jgi:hypothetical protein
MRFLNKSAIEQSTISEETGCMRRNSSFAEARKPGRGQENPAAELSRSAVRACRELAVQIKDIKNNLHREFGTTIGGNSDLLRSALNEAEALAWQTPYPHLLFPVLAQEKAFAVSRWAARQRSVRRASKVISLTE